MPVDSIISDMDTFKAYVERVCKEDKDNASRPFAPGFFRSPTEQTRIIQITPTTPGNDSSLQSVMIRISRVDNQYAVCYIRPNLYPLTDELTNILKTNLHSIPVNYLKTLPPDQIRQMATDFELKAKRWGQLLPVTAETALRTVTAATILEIAKAQLEQAPTTHPNQSR